MKNKRLLFLFPCIVFYVSVYTQSTTAGLGPVGHTGAAVLTDWCGWNAATPIPFNLEHRGAQGINFLTGPTLRMTILGTAAGPMQGFVGIGPNFANPTSLLHLSTFGVGNGNVFRSDGNDANINRWQMFTGPIAGPLTEKLTIFTAPFLPTQTFYAQPSTNHVAVQSTQGDVILRAYGYNLSSTSPAPQEVVRVTRTRIAQPFTGPGGLTDEGRVSIARRGGGSGPIVEPYSMLHIGDQLVLNPPYNNPVGTFGWRPWMDVGTFYALVTDNMYVGLKAVALDETIAVINWGNNPSANPGNGDRLVFCFTAAQNPGNGTATGPDGLEVGRLWTDGTISRTGFGGDATNLYSTGTQDPGNTLEVNSFGLTTAAGGSSGLRFTNLTAASPATTNVANGGVLSVDANGDVILVQGSGGGTITGANNGTSTSTVSPTLVVLGQNVGQVGNPAQLISDREIPLNGKNLIISGAPETFPGKVGIGIVGGINNANPLSLRPTQTTLQVNGSISVFDGSGNASVFFGEEQYAFNSGTLGSWGIQYTVTGTSGPGLNFWKPFGSSGYGFGNSFLFLSDNGNVGIGATSPAPPANALEITSYPTSPQPAGLRFTNLTASSPVVPAFGPGVLSVDGNGDVVLVPGGTITFGGACGNPNTMVQDFEIPMGNFNLIFSGQSTSNDARVGIGMPAGNCQPLAKLDVRMNAPASGTIAIFAGNVNTDGIAIKAVANGGASSANTKIAGWFESPAGGGLQQTAIFVPDGGGMVSIGYNIGQTVVALVDVDGSVNSMGVALSSDATLKHNVNSIDSSMSIIMNLQPVTFEWNTASDSMMSGMHSGFIAQQVDSVLPHVVKMRGDSIKTIAYLEIIPYLVAALQEEHQRNDSLASQLDSLTNVVSGCCNSSARISDPDADQTDVTLTNSESVVLNQNVPNPFAEQTTITYYLPETTVKAQMLFYDAQGKLIKAVDLEGTGNGQLNVFADDLTNGVYSYALVVDGQVMDTKQMVKTK